MTDWNDYAYTMVVEKVVCFEVIQEEINSDSLLFLIDLGTGGLEEGLYISAQIHQNPIALT